jgi:excisionase family DNA binding protein
MQNIKGGTFIGSVEGNEMNEFQYMTVKEVARYLRLAEITIYRLAEKKDLPGYKAGRLWRFIKNEIDDWLRSRR